jgi:tripartite-type tricarboxylate transporter receptor subunit TctC
MIGRCTLLRGAALLAAPALARAANWPKRPVTLQVPFAAGGPTDVMARVMVRKLAEVLGQPVLVENIGSPGGILGMERTARAAPDGYTIGLGHMGTLAANTAFFKQLPYDPLNNFEPLGLFAVNPMVLAVRPGMGRSLGELRQWIVRNPARLTIATAGMASVSFLGALLFDRAVGAQATLVPYPGAGPALQDTMNGVTDAIVDQAITVIPQAMGGTLRALVVTVPHRLYQMPGVPTSAQAGLPGFDIAVWNAAVAPRGTPEAVTRRLTEAIDAVLEDDTVKERFTELAVEIPSAEERGPEVQRALTVREISRWVTLAREMGVEPE